MFNLEQSLAAWRSELARARLAPAVIAELEIHLRDSIAAQMAAGEPGPEAFVSAVQRLGPPANLKTEFNKLRIMRYNLPLAWIAWALFVVSFFLPAYEDDYGWQCADLSATSFPCFQSWWSSIHFLLLTPANVVMVVAPFLLAKFPRRPVVLNVLRACSLVALALVWSFIALLVAEGARSELKMGCYVWVASFLLSSLSLFRLTVRKERHA
jgi:hypothetical protein